MKEKFLRNICKFEDGILTPLYFFVFAAFICIPALLVMFLVPPFSNLLVNCNDNDIVKASYLFLAIAIISLFGWAIYSSGLNPSRIAYLIKGKYFKYFLKTVYTLNFNGEIVPLKVIGLSWPHDGDVQLVCKLKNVTEMYGYNYDDDWGFRKFYINEVFLQEEDALNNKNKIRIKQREALSSILGDDVSEAFLKSNIFKKYADSYYKKTWLDNYDFAFFTFENFLLSPENLYSFCEFMDDQIREEEEYKLSPCELINELMKTEN